MILRLALVMVLAITAGIGQAEPLGTSIRPLARPAVDAGSAADGPEPVAAAVLPAPDLSLALSPSLSRPQRPTLRPPAIVARAQAEAESRRRGQICGDPALQGRVLDPIRGSGGCGIAAPVEVRSVAGVRLRDPGTMDCQTASALRSWTERSAIPALRDQGGGLAALIVAGSYTCRPRNNQVGARLSEHGKGHAVDIAGVELRNGSTITVRADWGQGAKGTALRAMHRGACGIFGTVLGPGSDRFHQDHLHFDTARYRSGSYCR